MQYILSEEEYKSLIFANEQFKKEHKEMVQKLCTMVAMNMPITPRWCKDNKNYIPKPWGCVLVKEHYMEYCDECPVKKECPSERKEWSK